MASASGTSFWIGFSVGVACFCILVTAKAVASLEMEYQYREPRLFVSQFDQLSLEHQMKSKDTAIAEMEL